MSLEQTSKVPDASELNEITTPGTFEELFSSIKGTKTEIILTNAAKAMIKSRLNTEKPSDQEIIEKLNNAKLPKMLDALPQIIDPSLNGPGISKEGFKSFKIVIINLKQISDRIAQNETEKLAIKTFFQSWVRLIQKTLLEFDKFQETEDEDTNEEKNNTENKTDETPDESESDRNKNFDDDEEENLANT